MSKRNEMMTQFKRQAREYDRLGDVTLRRQAAQNWRELATDAESQKAPTYLTWPGRK
jgi:hypothetical protein